MKRSVLQVTRLATIAALVATSALPARAASLSASRRTRRRWASRSWWKPWPDDDPNRDRKGEAQDQVKVLSERGQSRNQSNP